MKRILSLILFTASLLPIFPAQADFRSISFTPPKLGAPADRIGRGTRSVAGLRSQDLETIQLLAPKQTALTSLASPTLYWYTSNALPYDVEITVRQSEKEPLFKKNIGAIKTSGIQSIRLDDYGVSLANGQNYTWSLTLIVDAKQPAANLFASGSIRRETPASLPTDIAQMTTAGYWYDAVARLVETKSPQLDSVLKQEDIRDVSIK